jgi:dTDP-4-amino-4,6-dideoxygalactose transaminase
MLSLVPSEHWDYNLADLVRGVVKAFSATREEHDSHLRLPGLGFGVPLRSGRAAIIVALKALALRPEASIAVPLYCCPVVFAAIKAAGYRPRFVDVDPDSYCLSPADLAVKSAEVDAVIAVHMFGNVCDMQALRSAAPGKPIIEDCAQGIGSCINGRAVGSFGEAAVFSFRSGKYISAGEGGAVYFTQKDIESRIVELVADLPAPSQLDEFAHIVKTYCRSKLRSKPLWGMIGERLWSTYNDKVNFTSQAPIVMSQIYETDRVTTMSRLPLLASLIAKQRLNAHYYSQTLRVDAYMLCREKPGQFFNRLQYPLLLPTPEQCEELASRLRKGLISTARPYKEIAAIAVKHYGYDGDCPRSEAIAKTVLVIPCNHSLKAADRERIGVTVNHAWAEISGGRRNASVPGVNAPMSNGDVRRIAEPNHSL